jgi:hypothetical protein
MPFTYSLCMLPGTLACLLYHTALDTNRILYFTDTIQHGTLSLTLSVSTVVRTISCRLEIEVAPTRMPSQGQAVLRSR